MPRKRELTFSVAQRKNVSKAGMEGFLRKPKGANGVEHSSGVEAEAKPASELGGYGELCEHIPEDPPSTCACVDGFWQQTRLKCHLHSLAECVLKQSAYLRDSSSTLEMELRAIHSIMTIRPNILNESL